MTERSRGDRYAVSALKNKRAALASEIVQLERQVRSRKDSLAHVDACLKLLDPSVSPEAIPNKRVVKHVNIFRQGELGRLILGALREADGVPLSTPEIAAAIMEKGGIDKEAGPTIRNRVRANLAYQEKRGTVVKRGRQSSAEWALTSS